MLFVGSVVWRYAIYRISNDCSDLLAVVCRTEWVQQRNVAIAIRTVNWAIVAAVLFNIFFWVFLGRSNPPGTSDSIQVLGKND